MNPITLERQTDRLANEGRKSVRKNNAPVKIEIHEKKERIEILREVYDMVMIFPYVEKDRVKQKRSFKLSTFQRVMLGLNKRMDQMNRYKAVFRTPRCRNNIFSDEFTCLTQQKSFRKRQDPMQRRKLTFSGGEMVEHLEEDRTYIEEWKAALRTEWNARIRELRGETERKVIVKDIVHDDLQANEHEYCVVVAKSIAQRLQLTCGLTTHLFKGYTHTELFLAVRADSADLREEAVRTKYRLPLRQRPFTDYNCSQEKNWNEHVYRDEVVEESEDHLFTVMAELDPRHSEDARAELDPLLFHAGDLPKGTIKDKSKGVQKKLQELSKRCTPQQLSTNTNGSPSNRLNRSRNSMAFISHDDLGEHQQLRESLALWGHHPDVDTRGLGTPTKGGEGEEESWISEFLEQLDLSSWLKRVFYIDPSDRDIFFSPYAEYHAEPKYQHYFRKHPVDKLGTALTNSPAFASAVQSGELKGRVMTNMHFRCPFSSAPVLSFFSSAETLDKSGDSALDEEARLAAGAHCCTLFRDVDRIRLVTSIINRHLNMQALKYSRRVKDYYGLHNEREITRLNRDWALTFEWRELWSSKPQPLLQIRDYFGEKIAIYFAWLEFYSKMLAFPMVLGALTFCFNFMGTGSLKKRII